MSIFILPRATRDFDFVVHLQAKDVDAFVNHFKDGYYCNAETVADAVKNKSMFNVIDHASGFKADFIILKNEAFRQTEFERRRKADFFGMPVFIVTAEDLLLSKLIWIQQLQSHLQMEDIKNLKAVPGIDWEYINHWINALNLNTFELI